MEITIWLIGFGAMAIVGLIFWDRLGRLEHEVKRLKAQVQDSPVAVAETAAGILAPSPPDDPVLEPLQPAGGDDTALPEESPPVEQPDPVFTLQTTEETSTAPVAEPASEAPSEPALDPAPTREARRRGFEQLFGARLAVWGGGIALAMAGFFLVKYSMDIGLITPPVRMVLGGLFGLGLLAGAEFVHRRPAIANGARIAQSLAGAGIAVLYAVMYIATTIYGLLPPTIGFLGLAATTAAALALSLRRGPPIAVMGLIGGFATPAMVSASTPNVPVLMLYLLLVIGGLMLLIRRQGWWWLAIPAALGGFGWVGLILTSHIAAENSVWLGLFLLAMTGMVFTTSAGDRRIPLDRALGSARALMPILTGGVALAQLAVIIGTTGFGWIDWGLFGLLAAACVVLGARQTHCILLPPTALTVTLALLALWPQPDALRFWIVSGCALALFAGAGYGLTWKSDQPYHWLGQAAAASLGLFAIAYFRMFPPLASPPVEFAWAGMALAMAAPAVLTAAIAQARRAETAGIADILLLIAAGIASALVAAALLLVVPAEGLPTAFALAAVAAILIANRLRAEILNWIAGTAGVLFAVTLATAPNGILLDAIVGLIGSLSTSSAAWPLLLPVAPLAVAAALNSWQSQRTAFAWAAVTAATLALVLLVPATLRPFSLAAEGLVLMLLARRVAGFGMPEQALTAAGLSVWQSLQVLIPLALATAPSLIGQPVYATELPALGDIALAVALPALPLAATAWTCRTEAGWVWRPLLASVAAVWIAILGYGAIKSLFGIDAVAAFEDRGFLERAVVTQSLFALGAAAFWMRDRLGRDGLAWAGMILTWTAVARLVWFDLLVFNPMVMPQAVGSWPVLNALLLTYGLPIAWLVLLQRRQLPLPGWQQQALAAKGGCLALILILALAQVRQLFQDDPMIYGPVGTAELYAYSAAALATAIGFLVWGVARGDQMTRLVSLGLMLAAIAKVFLYDASELTGLWRIAAFAGLGVSLLGISWLYSRYVFVDRGGPAGQIGPPESAAGSVP